MNLPTYRFLQKMSQAKRVCMIGAGPSGMSVLYQFDQLRKQGKEIPAIVCYDAQSDWGGLWKYSWRTGKECNSPLYTFSNPQFDS